MKIEARRDDIRITLETNTLTAHALVTDQRAAVQAAVERAASWFQAEVSRLLAPPTTEPVLDVKGREIGRRITEPNASPLVYHGRTFDDDPLAEFRPEPCGAVYEEIPAEPFQGLEVVRYHCAKARGHVGAHGSV